MIFAIIIIAVIRFFRLTGILLKFASFRLRLFYLCGGGRRGIPVMVRVLCSLTGGCKIYNGIVNQHFIYMATPNTTKQNHSYIPKISPATTTINNDIR